MTILNVVALSGLVLAAALGGCSSSSSNHDMAPAAKATAPTQAKPSANDYMPNYMASTSAGRVMTTPQGATVYTSDRDQAGKSNCYGDCALKWPPVIANTTALPYGRMSLAARQDGQRQWAYDGKPLYTYTEDATYGDVKGENADSIWHVVK